MRLDFAVRRLAPKLRTHSPKDETIETTETTMPAPSSAAAQDRDALLDRLVQAASNTFMLFGVHPGTQLGFYDELAWAGPTTSTGLARRTATNERS